MDAGIRNIPFSRALVLSDEIACQEGQVVSRTLARTPSMNMTLFAFSRGEGLSTHASGGDAFVTVLEGAGRFTIDGVSHVVRAGGAIVMPAGHPHAVDADEDFKMLLVVVFPPSPSEMLHGTPAAG